MRVFLQDLIASGHVQRTTPALKARTGVWKAVRLAMVAAERARNMAAADVYWTGGFEQDSFVVQQEPLRLTSGKSPVHVTQTFSCNCMTSSGFGGETLQLRLRPYYTLLESTATS